jgi:hypothetical protein
VWAGAAIAAIVTGERLHGGLADGVRAAIHLPDHLAKPQMAWPDRRDQASLPGPVGYWSAKDVIAHLASYELVLVEVLQNILEPRPTPLVDEFKADGQAFNDRQVDVMRRDRTMQEVLDEYLSAYEGVAQLAKEVPTAAWRRMGILPWYGPAYDLEDFIVYTYYGHKREHCGQIQTSRDRLR